MNRPRLSPLLRLQFLGFLMLLGLGALAARLWWVQVARGAEWTARIRGSSEATVRIPSIRGEIRDRNGVPLVQNRASYEVDFYLPEMVKGYRQRYGQPPITDYRGTISGMPKDLKEPDIVKIVNGGIVPRLDDLDLARDYNASQLQKHYRTNTEVPYTYIKDIDFPTMAKFSEHDVGLPGVDIAIKPVRSYVYGAFAAHLLGYVGAPDDINKEDAKKYTFFQGDVEGKSNIEKCCTCWQRPTPPACGHTGTPNFAASRTTASTSFTPPSRQQSSWTASIAPSCSSCLKTTRFCTCSPVATRTGVTASRILR